MMSRKSLCQILPNLTPSESLDPHRAWTIGQNSATAPKTHNPSESEWVSWLANLRQLCRDSAPGDVPPRRWKQALAAADYLVKAGWIECAAELGWIAVDLFGCDVEKPFARIDRCGLVWFIGGGDTVVSMSMSAAIIQRRTGARQTYRRRDAAIGQVPLWDLLALSATLLRT